LYVSCRALETKAAAPAGSSALNEARSTGDTYGFHRPVALRRRLARDWSHVMVSETTSFNWEDFDACGCACVLWSLLLAGLTACGQVGTQVLSQPDTPSAVAPSIATQPTDQIIKVGDQATFAVAATGSAPLSYQWQQNGASIAGATAASYTTPAAIPDNDGTPSPSSSAILPAASQVRAPDSRSLRPPSRRRSPPSRPTPASRPDRPPRSASSPAAPRPCPTSGRRTAPPSPAPLPPATPRPRRRPRTTG